MVRRKVEDVLKFLVYGISLILLYVILLVGLLKVTAWVSESGWLHKLVGDAIRPGSDMAAYVIAAATLEFTILTIFQQHFTRQQDRTLNFPDICIEKCDLIIKPEKVMNEVFGIDAYKGEFMVKFFVGKSFPVYYEPKIHKAWVKKEKYMSGENKTFKMQLLSSRLISNPGSSAWLIQVGDQQGCIYETVVRNQVEKVQALRFCYDISWENQLLPKLSRMFSKLYMRLIIYLDDAGIRNENGCSIGVRELKISKIPMSAPTL